MTYTTVELILSATKVNEEWLAELAPHFYAREEGASKPADGLRMEGAPAGSKRPREESESGPPAPAPAPAGGVAAMLGESLFGGGAGRTFF